MAGSTHAAVTPSGIRDGEPAALAALVERRANAVLAYCEAMLGPQEAERAAAEAFARFRAAVATAADARSLDPETLLIGATRHAAADLTPAPAPESGGSGLRRRLHAGRGVAPETCAQIPGLLAGRAEGALSDADGERLTRHLERHAACGALAERAANAERAYAAPPERTVPTGALTEILLALTAAAPVLAVPDDSFDFGIDLDELPPPTYQYGITEVDDSPTPTEALTVASPLPDAAIADLEAEDVEPDALDEDEDEDDALEGEDPQPDGAVRTDELIPVQDPYASATDDHDPGGQTEVLPAVAVPGSGRGVPHPRPQRGDRSRAVAPSTHGLIYRYLLPGAFVAATLLIVMAIAGVFSSDPASNGAATTSSTLPAAPPAGAPPVSSAPTAPRTPAQDAAVRRAATAARKAREAKAAARKKAAAAAEEKPATSSSPAATTGQAPPAVVLPAPAKPTSTPPSRTLAQPSTAQKPAGGTVEQQSGKSSSALPGADASALPGKDPGVFEGTTP